MTDVFYKFAGSIMSTMDEISSTLRKSPIAVRANNFTNYIGNTTTGALGFTNKITADTPLASINQDLFAKSMARMEGYYNPKSLAAIQNNPGNIRFGQFAQSLGGTMGSKGFAKFNSPEAGFNAMQKLYNTKAYKDLTVGQAINRWAPPIENNTDNYINSVLKMYNGG